MPQGGIDSGETPEAALAKGLDKIETMVQSVISNARKAGAPAAFDKVWTKILQKHLGAWKHAEFGLGTSLMQAQRYGYTQMINNATLTNSSYKMRLAQDITLYLAEIGMDIDGWNDELGKKAKQAIAGGIVALVIVVVVTRVVLVLAFVLIGITLVVERAAVG